MRGLVALLGGLCLLGFATVEGRGTEALAADAKYAAVRECCDDWVGFLL